MKSALIAVIVIAGWAAPAAQSPGPAARIDSIFNRWTTQTPGCAVGASVKGKTVVEKAYGLADLEHDVPNRPDTIFEAGSVSKQFTAAAVLLLARDGKLSLDDEVRKHVPELPDYGTPLTIRHMLNHTSGLRDWGSVASIAGWPRTARVHSHAHVLDILSRQKALNFTPGTRYSYSNSGYNLLAIIVSRVSGMPFAEFSQKRIFEPLGMTHTSWRDDHTRIVKGRAMAYRQNGDKDFRIQMPFENVHGNGGLLTTVGDLLKWNRNFVEPKVGDAAFVAEMQTLGKFADGSDQAYALGLQIGTYKGVRQVGHSGSTAGYRAHLVMYPDQDVSVAVLCNVSSGNATQYATAVSDELLGSAIDANATRTPPNPMTRGPVAAIARDASYKPSASDLAAFAGTYTSDEAETTMKMAVEEGGLVVKQRPDRTVRLQPRARDTFEGGGSVFIFRRDPSGTVTHFSIVEDRVWDLRFRREAEARGSRP
jgi:CubicO group peptidase (beta-lactamase class C family)